MSIIIEGMKLPKNYPYRISIDKNGKVQEHTGFAGSNYFRAIEVDKANPWHTGKPTEVEDDIYWKWNYALVLNTAYDCIGNYLAGMLFVPNFEKNVFSAPLGNGKNLEVPFNDVIAWQKITPFEAIKEN